VQVPLLAASVTRWECPNCTFRDTTREAQPHTRFHACSGLGGLTAPMVREGERVKVVVNEREDYIGGEDVQYADGRPVMNVITERGDGSNDLAVYLPTAHGSGRA
jgi:hypothetical protein